jgi:hypothetical protein
VNTASGVQRAAARAVARMPGAGRTFVTLSGPRPASAPARWADPGSPSPAAVRRQPHGRTAGACASPRGIRDRLVLCPSPGLALEPGAGGAASEASAATSLSGHRERPRAESPGIEEPLRLDFAATCGERRPLDAGGALTCNVEGGGEGERQGPSMPGSTVMILHGFRAGSRWLRTSVAAHPLPRRRRSDLRHHNPIGCLHHPSCVSRTGQDLRFL